MVKKALQGSQTKVETLTIRVSPKMKFGLELLSRKQHRTLTSVAEWALDKALHDEKEGLVSVEEDWINGGAETIFLLDKLWDPDEVDRLMNLATQYSNLLTYEEELVWKTVKEAGFFWQGRWDGERWKWRSTKRYLIRDRVKKYWIDIQKIASGDVDKASLPEVTRDNAQELPPPPPDKHQAPAAPF